MKTVKILSCMLLLCMTPVLFAQDPTAVAPGLYKKVFENDQVRVLEVSVKPGEKIATHSHPAHVAYVVEGGKLKITDSTGKPMEADAKPGDVFWFDPVTHSAENTGTVPMKLVVVELKNK
jgi:beta-alanine degradation protein BauB